MQPAQTQDIKFHSPVEIPFLLAGNFGEPRPNHFHCGIDVKTQGVENKKILAVCDGYVARMTSGLYGFGNALYVVHPNGYMSVYCHLNDFVPELQKILRERQYAEESERVDVKLPPGVFPVKAGQWIAYSGNTGLRPPRTFIWNCIAWPTVRWLTRCRFSSTCSRMT